MNLFKERRVLHIGCGPKNAIKLHPVFQTPGWNEIRLDIDENVEPDIISSMTDMRASVEDKSCDAIWSSHNIEHLYAHEAPLAFAEFRRVLRDDGFALITCPDVAAVAQLIVDGRFSEPAYQSPAGAIFAADMLWGHRPALAKGNDFMAHRMGFTCETLGQALIEAEFGEAWVFSGEGYALWAVAVMDRADHDLIHAQLSGAGLYFPD
jgi:predicted SAM-dependent methyltransferase